MFDCAVESRVAIEVTPDTRVESDCVSARARDCAEEMDAATDPMVLPSVDREVWLDWADERTVDTLASRDRSVDVTLETDTAADSTAELDVPSEVAADVIAEVEMMLLITTSELRNEEFSVDSEVAALVTAERLVDVDVSIDTLPEICD